MTSSRILLVILQFLPSHFTRGNIPNKCKEKLKRIWLEKCHFRKMNKCTLCNWTLLVRNKLKTSISFFLSVPSTCYAVIKSNRGTFIYKQFRALVLIPMNTSFSSFNSPVAFLPKLSIIRNSRVPVFSSLYHYFL